MSKKKRQRRVPAQDPNVDRFLLGPGARVFDRLCDVCVHYLGDRKCRAYPAGIPDEIWQGRAFHLSPLPGDKGIQFARRKSDGLS